MRSISSILHASGMLVLTAMPLCAMIDLDGDGISDVWAALYPDIGVPDADPDGDGATNREEANAGTNPTDAEDHLAATLWANAEEKLMLSWPSVFGKRYRIETSTDLGTWTDSDSRFTGTGDTLTETLGETASATSPSFWRVAVDGTEADSDSDGLNDWEEIQLGSDPSDADSDRDGMNDKQEFWQGTSPTTPDPCPVEVSHGLEPPRDVVVVEADDLGCTLAWTADAPPDGQTIRYFDILLNGRRVARTSEQHIRVGYDPFGSYLQFFSVRTVNSSGVSSAGSDEVLAPRSHEAVLPRLLHKRASGVATQNGFAGFTTNKCYRKCSEYFDQTWSRVGDRSGVIVQYENRWVNSSESGLSGSYSQNGYYGSVSFSRPNPEREREVLAYLARPHGGEGPYPGLYPLVLGTDTEKEYVKVGSGRAEEWGPLGYEWITWAYDEKWRIQLSDEVTEAEMDALGQQRLNQARGALAGVDWDWLSFVGDSGAGLEPLGWDPGPPFAVRDLDIGGPQGSVRLTGIHYRLVSDDLGPTTFRWREVFHSDEGSIMQTVRDIEEKVANGNAGAATQEYWIEPPATNGLIAVEPYSRHLEILTQSRQPEAGKSRLFLLNTMYVGEAAELAIVFYDEGGDFPEKAKISWAGNTDAIALRAVDPCVVLARGLPAALAEGTDVPNGTDLLGQEHAPGMTSSIATAWQLYAIGVKAGSVDFRIESTMPYQGDVRAIEQSLAVYPALDLAVDANRDGEIKLPSEDDSDATSAEKPFRFWINDDDDHCTGVPGNDGEEHVPVVRPDHSINLIGSRRDLEDYARLWISTQGLNAAFQRGDMFLGLKWEVTSGAPSIKVFPSVEADGGAAYLTDGSTDGIARQQATQYALIDERHIHDDRGLSTHTTVGGTDVFVLPTSLFANLSETQPKTFLLFEGCSAGKGQLKLVILDKNKQVIGEGPGVWMELCNIKSMYVRTHTTPTAAAFTPPYKSDHPSYLYEIEADGALRVKDENIGYENGDGDEADGLDGNPVEFPFVPAWDEDKSKCVVFVHGVSLTVDAVRAYSESFVKRLWWEGYRGRFVLLRWGTPIGADIDRLEVNEGPWVFSDGEMRSWAYGNSLKKLVANLRTELGAKGVISVAGHSLGNACVGSALRQGMVIDNYVLLEAAVPMMCYHAPAGDPQNDPLRAHYLANLLDAEEPGTFKATYENYTELGYRGFLQSIAANVKDRIVSYHNRSDYWLATGDRTIIPWLWEPGVDWVTWQRKYKPFQVSWTLEPDDYQYAGWNELIRSSTLQTLRPVRSPYEAMPFIARSRTRAVGGEPAPDDYGNGDPKDYREGGPAGYPLTFQGQRIDLKSVYGFGTAQKDHSGQFLRNIQELYSKPDGTPFKKAFYRQLMEDLKVVP